MPRTHVPLVAVLRGIALLQLGRPDDGTDSNGFYNSEFFVTLKPESQWPVPPGRSRSRTKPEIVDQMGRQLRQTLFSVDWNFSQNIRDNVMESLSGVKGDNSVKIFGPDLDELEKLADEVKTQLTSIRGIAGSASAKRAGRRRTAARASI